MLVKQSTRPYGKGTQCSKEAVRLLNILKSMGLVVDQQLIHNEWILFWIISFLASTFDLYQIIELNISLKHNFHNIN